MFTVATHNDPNMEKEKQMFVNQCMNKQMLYVYTIE